MKNVFPIIPASSTSLWFLSLITLLMLGLVVLCGYLAFSSRHTRFEVSADGLRIIGTIYGRRIPAASILLDGVRSVDLTRDRDYQTTWRTNGAGLPGYKAGWFRLRNGEKALAFLTHRQRVVYIPTHDGYAVLLSVPEPHEFIQALESELAGT